MVSTRGVKFKFSEGERVLCYEPDPTKAKVLYDSKVLELNVSRDSRGRKIPEYLIHFYGWSSSWDRCVKEEFILPDTEENRSLQTKLAEDAAQSLKGKRKSKVPPIIKETLCKKESSDPSKEEAAPPVFKKEVEESSSDSESSDEESDEIYDLHIPDDLKAVLEVDWCNVTQKDKVTKLPCEQNVISILEDYIKYLAADLLSAVEKGKNEREMTVQNVEDKLNYCKEVVDGLRIYFDFTLPHLLLYRQEKKQFYTVGNTCVPVCRFKSEESEIKNGACNSVASTSSNSIHSHKDVCDSKGSTHNTSSQSSARAGLRNQGAIQKLAATNDDDTQGISSRQRATERMPQNKKSSGTKKIRTVKLRQGLRSSDRIKSADDETGTNDASSGNMSGPESDHSPASPNSPPIPTNPPRQTRHSSQNSPSVPIVSSSSSSSSSSGNRLPASHKQTSSAPVVNSTLGQPMLTVFISNINSSPCSPPSRRLLSPKTEKRPLLPLSAARLRSEIESWRMLPQYLYEQIPAAPSLVYGGFHLLRLLVKLPELLHKVHMPQKRLLTLMNEIENFIEYLCEKKEELFIPIYIDSGEELC